MHPVSGSVSQEFGARPDFLWQLGYGHLGIDYAVPEGTPIRAIADCTILWADWCINMPASFANANMFIPGAEGGGKTIVAQNDGYRAIYAHLSSFAVRSGDRVKRGDIIGHSGWTGNVVPRNPNGAHLHFEVYTYPCSNYPPFSRYNPRNQIAEEDRIAGAAPSIVPAGNITPAAPTPKEGFLMALNDQQQKELYDRIMGGIPAGAARPVKKGESAPRLADSTDIAGLLTTTQAQHDVTRAHLINSTQAQQDVTRAYVIGSVANATQEQQDITRQFLSGRIAEGVKPAEVADSVIAAMGADLANQVVQELATRLTTQGGTK